MLVLCTQRDALLSQLEDDTNQLLDWQISQWHMQFGKQSLLGSKIFDIDTGVFLDDACMLFLSWDSGPFLCSANTLHGNLVTVICYLLLVTLQLLCHISNAHCNFILATLELILCLCGPAQGSQRITDPLPCDVRTIMSQLDLEPSYHTFLCCPACFKCYNYSSKEQENFPFFCSNRIHPDAPLCEHALRRMETLNGRCKMVPYKTYIRQDLKDWLGHMLWRLGMEQILDVAPFPMHDK